MLSFLIFRFSIKIPRGLSIVKNTIHGLCKNNIKQNCVENGMRESKRLEGKGGVVFVTMFGDGDGRFQNDI